MTNQKPRSVLLFAAMIFVAALVVAWWGEAFDGADAPAPSETPGEQVGPVSGENGGRSKSPVVTTSRRGEERASSTGDESGVLPWTATGRCVDEVGQPLTDVAVEVAIGEDVIGTVTSEPDGSFELEAEVDGERNGQIRLEAEGRVALTGRLRRPLPGERADLGDLLLRRAVRVAGRVVDTSGEPVAGVRVMFVRIELTGGKLPTGVGTDASAKTMLIASSDAQGRFEFDSSAWAGEWFIGAEYTGALVEPRNVQIDPEANAFDLQIVVEKPDPNQSIIGRVVDDLGRPVAGTRAVLMGHGFIGRGLSDADGNVVIARAGPLPQYGRTGMNVDLDHDSYLYEWPDESRQSDIQWGARDVEFRLIRRASRAIRVVDSRGEPVENYVLNAYSGDGDRWSRYSRIDVRGFHPDGRCTLEGLFQGQQGVVVVPADASLASTEVVTFDVEGVTPGPEQLVVVPDIARCEIELVTAGGDRVEGSGIELIQLMRTGTFGVQARAIPIADADRSRSIEQALILASGTTDGAGFTRLDAPPGTWTLRVRGADHVDQVEEVVVGPGSNRLRVVVQVGASVRGRIGPESALASLVDLTRSEGEGLFVDLDPAEKERPTVTLDVGEDGRYAAAGLPVGEYTVRLRVEYDSSEFQTAKDSYEIGRRTLAEGATEEFAFDASACLPGRVDGRVTVDGEPLGGVHCFLIGDNEGARRSMLRVGTDAEGRFEALVRPAGYRLMATMPAQPGPGWVRVPAHGQTWRVGPGGEARIDASIRLRRATLKLVDTQGDPLVGMRVRVIATDYGDPTPKQTGTDGSVRIDPAPPGEFRVRLGEGSAGESLGPFSLPPGALDGEITIRVE